MRVRLFAAAVLGAAVALPSMTADPPAAGPPPAERPTSMVGAASGALIAPGRSPELEILFTGDVVGFLEPCG